ncbi:aminotransferase class I/II-fold pyridoxal phosphate-dependent enzyme, partial [Intestinimonas massiliensis]|uniref:aminotransferase class I/II-fold pyridoxal phosphate-dependent enzyme n=1 Tax=Intestinimonas massiliensis (ex Afouda et al. 2020) TaxID=1673721 RepID=UPI00210A1155
EGLAHIALTLADEGDVVLVPDPCYPVFADGPKLAGAELHYMPMKPEKDFVIDLRDIPTEVAKRAKLDRQGLVNKAPANVVEAERERAGKLTALIAKLE